MCKYIEGQDRQQVTSLPERMNNHIGEDNTVRSVDAFITELDPAALKFQGMQPASAGRPSYSPSVFLKLKLDGYLNRIQSSRRLERECKRNVELMWLIDRLAPDLKTIAASVEITVRASLCDAVLRVEAVLNRPGDSHSRPSALIQEKQDRLRQ